MANILIVSPTKVGLTETFIRAHIDRLDGTVYYLYGWNLEFNNDEDVSLAELYRPPISFIDKFKALLPHHLYFKLAQKNKLKYSKEALIKRYITEHRIDVVLAEYGTSGSFIAPICAELDLPLIVHFHGIDASSYEKLNRFKDGYQYMFKQAYKIISVSNAMSQAIKKLGCPEHKIVLNTYGPHPNYLKAKANHRSNYLISVGRHTYKKAPYLTILAFEKVLKSAPDLKLKMIGDGELFDVSKNLVEALGLEEQVILLGGLEREDIINHLETAFLFVQHSLVAINGDSEGTPVGIIEAMAAGLPVVSTIHAGIPDVVIHGETGYLGKERDVDQMAVNILRLANNRSLAQKFGEKGKSRIGSKFTMERHLETLNMILDGI